MSDPKQIEGVVRDGVVILVGTDRECWDGGSHTATSHGPNGKTRTVLAFDIGVEDSFFVTLDVDPHGTARMRVMRDAVESVRKEIAKDVAEAFGISPAMQRAGDPGRFRSPKRDKVKAKAHRHTTRGPRRRP